MQVKDEFPGKLVIIDHFMPVSLVLLDNCIGFAIMTMQSIAKA